MKKPVSIQSPGQLTVLAALVAGLSASCAAIADPAPVSHLVISQVYGAGGNAGSTYTQDFIEVFNPTAGPLSVNGMSVQYQSATGTTWAATPLTNVTLQAGQYYLVGLAGTAGTVAPDATGGLNLSGTTGKAALATGTTAMTTATQASRIVDLVGFGSANSFEGAVGPAPSTITSISRLAEGCADTDNNANDFVAGAIAPRNTATTAHVCGAPVLQPIVPNCPANFSVQASAGGSTMLRATDGDSIVTGASITTGATAGIALGAFSPSAANGQEASVSLSVAPGMAPANYPLVITFSNGTQTATCNVTVNVQGVSAVTKRIFEIQGNGPASPYADTVQTTEGVVTAKVGNGFFLQDAQGDNDVTTSDAVFVFVTGASVNVGDLVRVTGTVKEFTPTGATQSVTEIANVSSVSVQGAGPTIYPTDLQLPITDFGPYQGMLVRFHQPLTVSQSEWLGTRGELTLSSGRLEVPTNHYRVGTPGALAMRAANDANTIYLDDGIFVAPNPIPYISPVDSTLRVGDTASDVTGVLDFGATGSTKGSYKIQPTLPVTFSRDNPRPTAPNFAAGANVKVASANVLNFFTTFTNGTSVFDQSTTTQGCSLGASTTKSNCRGADNLAEFIRQRDKIVNALKTIDADVFGLMEIQNNGETTVGYLVDSLNAAIGSTVYAVVPKPPATGTDAIRVSMIYKPAKLSLVGASMSDADSVNNRPPMAQTFLLPNGAKFSLIVNHLKSKGSCPASGETDTDGQGCWNATRVRQATRLGDSFVPAVIGASGTSNVLLIGDFNAHGFEDPINTLTDNYGFVNQLERYVRPTGTPYSFIFNNESGYLDHALASAAMSPQVVLAGEFHNNADEPTVIDYNTDGKPQDLYVNNAYRASDHDPVVISLNVAAPYTDVSASMSTYRSGFVVNRATGQYSGTFAFTNATGAAINGPFQLELGGLPANVTLSNATGSHNGVPYITVPNASIAPGATISVSTVFANPGKIAITYSAKIYSGSF